MTGSTNIRPMAEVIAPAVCRMIAPRPKAISATTVTNTAVPITAASTVPGEIVAVPWKRHGGRPVARTACWPLHDGVGRDRDRVEQRRAHARAGHCRLADEERDERGHQRDDQCHRGEDDQLREVDGAAPRHRGHRGADHPGGVLGGDAHGADHGDDQLAELEEGDQRRLGGVRPPACSAGCCGCCSRCRNRRWPRCRR